MGDWQSVITLLQGRLDEWAAYLSQIPRGFFLAALLFPVALGLFSKRVLVIAACLLLAVVAFCVLAAPASLTVTLATGIYLGGLILAVAGIVARRKAQMLQAQLTNLRWDMDRLLSDQERRYLAKLRSSAEKKEG